MNSILIGIVDPVLLQEAQADPTGSLAQEFRSAGALEIRYDLFPHKDQWANIAAQVRSIAPGIPLLGTIRLRCDGGLWPDEQSGQRLAYWESILNCDAPEWLDLEFSVLEQYRSWVLGVRSQGVRILASAHNFQTIPKAEYFAEQLALAKAIMVDGFKIAAMSRARGDCAVLYRLAQSEAKNFTWFAAFAMGETGMVSRLYSLQCGANVSYGCFGHALAPGQISLRKMQKILHAELQSDKEEDWWSLLKEL